MNQLEKNFERKTGIKFKDFYKEYKPKFTWHLSKWTKDLSIAEDFADDAFLKALTSIDGYNGKMAQVHTWLYTIGVNLVKKDYQEKQRLPSISMDRELANNANMAMFLPYTDGKKEMNKHNEFVEKAQIIRDAILDMPEKQHKYKTVLVLRELENYTYKEIAHKLDLNLSTVKSQIKQGREIIRNKISRKLELIDEHGLI